MTAVFFPKWVDGRPTVEHILRATAEAFGKSRKDLIGDGQHGDVIVPRQVAMFLALELTMLASSTMERQFRRDRTTITHGAARTMLRLDRDPELRTKVEQLRRRLAAPVPAAPIGSEVEPVQLDFLPGPLFDFPGAGM